MAQRDRASGFPALPRPPLSNRRLACSSTDRGLVDPPGGRAPQRIRVTVRLAALWRVSMVALNAAGVPNPPRVGIIAFVKGPNWGLRQPGVCGTCSPRPSCVPNEETVMNWTDYVQAIGAIATAGALVVALWVGLATMRHARVAASQSEKYEGAQSAIAWREQVFALHDRGLSPGQIRFIMHLEDGGPGYEGWNGGNDDLVRDMPRVSTGGGGDGRGINGMLSCPKMPVAGDACRGWCVDALRKSGCIRVSVNETAAPPMRRLDPRCNTGTRNVVRLVHEARPHAPTTPRASDMPPIGGADRRQKDASVPNQASTRSPQQINELPQLSRDSDRDPSWRTCPRQSRWRPGRPSQTHERTRVGQVAGVLL